MLKKLLKHEFKATGRFFLPVYGIFAALLVVERLGLLAVTNLRSDNFLGQLANFVTGLFTTITIVGCVALAIAPIIYAINRFYKNMLGDEGYLTHTLPVTPSQHIFAKLFATAVWSVATLLVALAMGTLFFLSLDSKETLDFFREFGNTIAKLYSEIGAFTVWIPLLFLITLLAQLNASILALYSAMSIGQTTAKHRLLASAGAYIGLQFVATTVLESAAVLLISKTDLADWLERLEYSLSLPQDGCRALCILLLILLCVNLLLAVGHFYLTRYMLTKKLNLA